MKTSLLFLNKYPNKFIHYQVVIVLCVSVLVSLSLYISARTGNWIWFQRSGSILTLSGVLFNGFGYLPVSKLITTFTVLGTLIWAYGDLLG